MLNKLGVSMSEFLCLSIEDKIKDLLNSEGNYGWLAVLDDIEKLEILRNESLKAKLTNTNLYVIFNSFCDDKIKKQALLEVDQDYIEEKKIQNYILNLFDSIKSKAIKESLLSKIDRGEMEFILCCYNEDDRIDFLTTRGLLKRISGKEISKSLIESNNDELTKLKQVIVKNTIPFEKTIFIISNLFFTEESLQKLLNDVYPENMLKYNDKTIIDIKNSIIQEEKGKIFNLKESSVREFLKEDLKEERMFNNKEMRLLLRKLLSNKYLDKELDVSYFEIFFKEFINNTTENLNIDVPATIDLCSIKKRGYLLPLEEIVINSRFLNNTMRKNITVFTTIFHEIAHKFQNTKYTEDKADFNTLQMVKDKILVKELSYYYDRGNNYKLCSFESDARCMAFVNTYKFLKRNNREIAFAYYLDFTDKYLKDLKLRRDTFRKENNAIEKLGVVFDTTISKEKIRNYMEIYPVLAYEYKKDGSRKDITTIISNIDKCANYSKHTNENKREYYFYNKLLKERISELKCFLANGNIVAYDSNIKPLLEYDTNDKYFNQKKEELLNDLSSNNQPEGKNVRTK